tara:strand:+ start:181 stop:768 length:588 start_codon:yes stop_codon:yes gene_type:complete
LPYNRKAIAPWSTEREQGIESATVDSNIETPQYLQPVVNTGNIDLNGNWIGVRTSDKLFTIDTTHEGVPNGAVVLSPQKAGADFIDMTGYNDIFIAIKDSRGGPLAIAAVMGPDTNTFANLTPVDGAALVRGNIPQDNMSDFENLFSESAQSCTVDVWNIFNISVVLANQKNLQFKITNNTGGNSDIDFAYLRMV